MSLPLVEAVFEFYSAAAPGWSQLSYARLEEQFKRRLPLVETFNPVEMEIVFGPGGVPHQRRRENEIRRLWRADRGELFQFSADLCAYNVLSAYTHFEDHVADLEAFYAAYLNECRPDAVRSVGQRYINKFSLPLGEPQPDAFFGLYPKLPPATSPRAFAVQVGVDRFDGGEVVLNLTYRGEELDRDIYFLDIYARSTQVVEPTAQALRAWQERAHLPVRNALKLALTAKGTEHWGLELSPSHASFPRRAPPRRSTARRRSDGCSRTG